MTDAWVQLINGGKFSLDGSPHELDGLTVADICKTLAQITRFRGATRYAYSVCQHSTFVSRIAEDLVLNDAPENHGVAAIAGLFGLVHDVHEIVVSDIPSPLKFTFAAHTDGKFAMLLREIEYRADGALWPIFGVNGRPPVAVDAYVKRADLIALTVEKRDLCVDRRPWFEPEEIRGTNYVERYYVEFQGDPQPAFMHRFAELHRKLAALRSQVPAE